MLISILFSGCVQDNNSYVEDEIPPHISMMNAKELLEQNIDSSNISIGVYDSLANPFHQEFYDASSQNSKVLTTVDFLELTESIYPGVGFWDWSFHGTAVSSIINGKSIGLAPLTQVINTPFPRERSTPFEVTSELYKVFNIDNYYPLPQGSTDFPVVEAYDGCKIDKQHPLCEFDYFSLLNETKAATVNIMPAINISMSFETFNFIENTDFPIDASYSDIDDKISKFYEYFGFDEIGFYKQIEQLKNVYKNGETILIISSGNEGESVSDTVVKDWIIAQESSDLSEEKKSSLVNLFKLPTKDLNKNGIIENNEIGLTDFILMVGALDKEGNHATYSNFPGFDEDVQKRFILAPADSIPKIAHSTFDQPNDAYLEESSGTSAAAPVISGIIALLQAKYPQITAREIVNVLLETANKDYDEYDPFWDGMGKLNVKAADEYLMHM